MAEYAAQPLMPSVWGIHDSVQGEEDPRPSGCGFYRIVLPLEQLKAHGWDADWRSAQPPPDEDRDVVVGERLDRDGSAGAWRRLRLKHRLVYELDDDVFNVNPINQMAWRVYGRPETQEVVIGCIEASDLVTVTVEPLAELIRPHNPNVAVIPNYIPAALLDIKRARRRRLTVGWTGGASHALDIAMIAEPLRRFIERDVPNADLHLVGCDFRPTIGAKRARLTQWVNEPRVYYQLIDFDIALAPLTGTVFDASKSNVKALEMAALGIPVIASDELPYRDFVIDGVTGFLVKTKRQWRERLRELAADRQLREDMGAKAKEIARGWTIEENWIKWDQAYRALL